MLKWRMESREHAYQIKNMIKETVDILDFISVAEAKKIAFVNPEIEDDDTKWGWRWSDLKGMNIYVRTLRGDGSYLYICDPTIPVTIKEITNAEESIPEELNKQDKVYADYFVKVITDAMLYIRDGRRKCMVWKKSKKKDVIVEEWPCWFHCWTNNRILKEAKAEGEKDRYIDQLLAVCEFQDGHIERIKHDHIRFVEEWD